MTSATVPRKHVLLAALFAFALALCFSPAAAFAGPTLSIEQNYTQPDGAVFAASMHGDEYFSTGVSV